MDSILPHVRELTGHVIGRVMDARLCASQSLDYVLLRLLPWGAAACGGVNTRTFSPNLRAFTCATFNPPFSTRIFFELRILRNEIFQLAAIILDGED
jgi:hypothetical protein